MKFGPVPPKKVPKQDPFKILLLAERWQRSAEAHSGWATRAKQAFDFFEGRQYTVAQIAKLSSEGRPSFKFNIIGALVRLVQGYQAAHKTDIAFQPGNDERSTENQANALTALEKAIASGCGLQYTDVEVFLDGLVSGRGYWDSRLHWDDNDFGELKSRGADPFGTYLDPDAGTYDLNESASHVLTTKMVSIDEIESAFGKTTADLIRPFTMGQTPVAPISSLPVQDEISPVRYFGEREDSDEWWDQYYSFAGNDFVDTYRKTVRIIEAQYKVREPRNVMIDLETGDKKVLPITWGPKKIEKVLLYAASINNPCVVENRTVERIHWTTFAADMMLYDAPSMYDQFTITPYFPYFRRGHTKGMVEDLIDPQMEKNKRRNAMIEIVGRTANGGWMYNAKSLTPQQKRNLKKFGSTPGVNIEWTGENELYKPQQIEMGKSPIQHERLEKEADEDFHAISGINPSALGEIDRVQSGRAIEARTKQAVISVQTYMDNFTRGKVLLGKQHLGVIQNHYTERRFYRVLGENSKLTKLLINDMQTDGSGVKRILNDVTIGKYTAIVDPAPLSATFQQAQFEEMMEILEKLGPVGQAVVPAVVDLIIGMSTLPQKDEWVARLQQVLGGGQAQQQPQAPGAGGLVGPDGQPIPPGAPPPAQLPPPQAVQVQQG